MSDAHLRELERRARGGDPRAEAEWLVARARRGEQVQLELLAWFGHPPALEALGLLPEREARARADAWGEWDRVVEAPELAGILRRWGDVPLGRAAVVLAHEALIYLEQPDAWRPLLERAAQRLRGEGIELLDPAEVPAGAGYYAQRGRRVCELALEAAASAELAHTEGCLLEAIDALQPNAGLAALIRQGVRERFPDPLRDPQLAACLGDEAAREGCDPPLSLAIRLRGLARFGALTCARVSLGLDLALAAKLPEFLGGDGEVAWRACAAGWLSDPHPARTRALIEACRQVGLHGLGARVLSAAGGDRAARATYGLPDQLRDARRRLGEAGVDESSFSLEAEIRGALVRSDRGGDSWGELDAAQDYVWRLSGPLVVVRAAESNTYRPIALALRLRDERTGEQRRGYLLHEDSLVAAHQTLVRALGEAGHPALVPLEGGRAEEGPFPGRLFLAAPLAQEGSFAEWAEGGADTAQRVALVRNLAEGLTAFQRAGGAPGRKLDPRRLRVTASGDPRLDLHGVDELAPLVDYAVIMPPNMHLGLVTLAPEAVLEAELHTPSMDAYALGALLYRLLGGRWPIELEGLQELGRLLDDAPPALDTLAPGLEPRLVQFVTRALARDPGDRFAGAAAVAEALAGHGEGME